jgi:hypothetical protein
VKDGRVEKVELTTTDLNLHRKVEGHVARRRFPEWKNVLRGARRRTTRRVCVDRRALITLLQAMETACPNPYHTVFIEFGEGENDGFVLRSASVENGQHAIGYMVPLDVEGDWLKMSPWERRTLARSIKRRKKAQAKHQGEEEAEAEEEEE